MRRRTYASLIAILLAGCAPAPVDVEVGFPSVETFLYSDSGRLLLYGVDPAAGLGACPAILDRVAAGDYGEPVLDSDWEPICVFRDGGVRFDDVPPGPHAYVMVARDFSNTVLLTGCRVAEAYDGAPSVSLDVFPTTGYGEATARRALTCASEMDKCAGGCR